VATLDQIVATLADTNWDDLDTLNRVLLEEISEDTWLVRVTDVTGAVDSVIADIEEL
jgi:hypothetical protein